MFIINSKYMPVIEEIIVTLWFNVKWLKRVVNTIYGGVITIYVFTIQLKG